MFRNRLLKVYRHRSKVARKQGVTCYRLYDRDLPEFPMIIEVYEGKVYVAEYESRHKLTEEEYATWWEECLEVIKEVMEVTEDELFTRIRHRKKGREGQYQRVADEHAFFQVQEGGLKFWVNLSDYVDTGLFLDHRITRGMVKEEARGKAVLNLFCYTGSFSVYAAAGGAERVCSVDLSNTYLNWARRNFALNGWEGMGNFTFEKADVLEYIRSAKHDRYDLIIVDPPTFSNSKMMEGTWDIQRDHADMLNRLKEWLLPEGRIYFSTNYRRFELERERLEYSFVKDITLATTPFDFAGKLQRQCFIFSV